MQITGSVIKDFGYRPGAWWKDAIGQAGNRDFDAESARVYLDGFAPVLVPFRTRGSRLWTANIEAEDEHERANIESVSKHMDELMRVPTVVAGAIMPDACPSDHRLGAIPVGGVAAAKEAIHPGMHSADICCSMAISIFESGTNPIALLNAGMRLSHFGGGGRPRGAQIRPSDSIMRAFENNKFLAPLQSAAIEHHATQGDGNHFFYVGRVKSSGQIALVTHHGSRGPGAKLYSAGMGVAEHSTRQISPETPAHNAWIPSETENGREYWAALQIVREWTKSNHYAVHGLVAEATGAKVADRFWNEHNFVFRRSDGLFYHAKGATPAYADYAADASGLTLIGLSARNPGLQAGEG